MKKFLILFFIFLSSLSAQNFKIATYNVENLFDLNLDGTEYKEYLPNSKYWNNAAFEKKLNNITKVIIDMDVQIIALQEIESQNAFNALKSRTNYKYGSFLKKSTSSVGVGLLSKYPIVKTETIDPDKYDKYSRYILKATIDIRGIPFIIYVNHWRSKRASESYRVKYAYELKGDIDRLPKDQDYVIVGDLNSNYDEFITFKYEKKLNDTYGITGINQVLNSSLNGLLVRKDQLSLNKDSNYNLWLEIEQKERFSARFRGENNTPDNILIGDELIDDHGISYMDKSFKVFKPSYLFDGYIKRWDMKNSSGFSDHLPIFASFSTQKTKLYFFKERQQSNKID